MNNIIYGLIDPNTKELRYIGKTSNQKRRFITHHAPSSLVSKSHLHNWIKSLLQNNQKSIMVVLETYSTFEELDIAEKQLIKYYRSIGCKLTNSTDGGPGAMGWIPTDETRMKISNALTGRKMPEEQKIKMSATLKGMNTWSKGSVASDETRMKMSESHKGINTWSKGKIPWNKGLTGTKASSETKALMSEQRRNRTWKLVNGKRVYSKVIDNV